MASMTTSHLVQPLTTTAAAAVEIPSIPTPLLPILSLLSSTLWTIQRSFDRVPGSAILLRYVKSSYQDDPYRSLLELFLVAFAIRTITSRRTRGEGEGKNWVRLSEKETDELVLEWTPNPLIEPTSSLTPTPAHPHPSAALSPTFEHLTLSSLPIISGPASHKPRLQSTGKQVLNLASPNWAGLLEDERLKEVAVRTLREYGVGCCGPPGFYGTMDVHTQLEQDLAAFLGHEAAIIYAQSFSTISSVIPAFAKRGDTIVADKGVNFAIQKGLQISRCNIKWYEHNDMQDLERCLKSVEREARRKGGPLRRRFIVTEGIFENDGSMLDLERVIELKKQHKFRLILDESFSFGMVGAHGRGLTEVYGIPATEIDILTGSMATGLTSGGGFCVGSRFVVDHQRINGTAFVYSAALPPLLVTCASAAVNILNSSPQLFTQLQENVHTLRTVLSKLEGANIAIPSDPDSALVHIYMQHPPESIEREEKLLQDVVEDALSQGLLITRSARLRGQETFEPVPSLKIMVSSAFTKKEMEKAAGILKGSLVKVLGKSR